MLLLVLHELHTDVLRTFWQNVCAPVWLQENLHLFFFFAAK